MLFCCVDRNICKILVVYLTIQNKELRYGKLKNMILYDYFKDSIREIMNKDVENLEVLRIIFFFVVF